MRKFFINTYTFGKDLFISPIAFFRKMPITEGIRGATYFALVMYFIRSSVFFLASWQQGYFFDPRFQAIPPVTVAAFAAISLIPFLLLLILYSQSIFLYRISNFFGGAGNLEAAYKVLAFVLLISLFSLVPYIGLLFHLYAILVLILAVREVFNIDWISSILALFFSFVFTAVLYVLFMFLPLYALHMIQIPL